MADEPLPTMPADAGKADTDAPTEFTATDSGLKYRLLRRGSGKKPAASNQVEVNYHGWLDDGKVFDSSYKRGESISFPLNRVIPGGPPAGRLLRQPGLGPRSSPRRRRPRGDRYGGDPRGRLRRVSVHQSAALALPPLSPSRSILSASYWLSGSFSPRSIRRRALASPSSSPDRHRNLGVNTTSLVQFAPGDRWVNGANHPRQAEGMWRESLQVNCGYAVHFASGKRMACHGRLFRPRLFRPFRQPTPTVRALFFPIFPKETSLEVRQGIPVRKIFPPL
jgi:hypothetical protein